MNAQHMHICMKNYNVILTISVLSYNHKLIPNYDDPGFGTSRVSRPIEQFDFTALF